MLVLYYFQRAFTFLAPLTGHFISKPIDVAAVLYKHTFPFTSFARTSRAKKLQRTFSQAYCSNLSMSRSYVSWMTKTWPKRTRCIYFSKHSLIERKTLSTETVNQTGHIDCKMICFHNTIISSLHSSAQKLSTSMWKEPLISSPPSISF